VRITAAALELMTTAGGDEEPVRSGPAVPPASAGDVRISPAGGEGHAPRGTRLARLVKRAIDVSAAAIGLVACAPVLAAVAIAVRVTMGRPVLFRQQRPGLHGRPFALVKFRTMRDGHGPDGERLTRLGRFLRACSLDELPELWNVLRGDMSLVGPRPLLVRYLPFFTDRERIRHSVRPGITGWAQVHGRNAVGWDERLALDAWYVDHWSPGLDLRILARTFAIVVARQGIQADGSDTMPEFQGSEVRS
jgi:lipopolysaccharide/colanic/teichoic acid biosynthesis glycosyltransferase